MKLTYWVFQSWLRFSVSADGPRISRGSRHAQLYLYLQTKQKKKFVTEIESKINTKSQDQKQNELPPHASWAA